MLFGHTDAHFVVYVANSLLVQFTGNSFLYKSPVVGIHAN